ncbi:GIY-YIG nuclease family protein [Methanobrevibacter cuticularis]|uniref:GIY-YIG nuclease family protein n=1 Tax=Methanobrevibacter cuticularis TaxID=47311 RepID=UPI000A05B3A9
MKGSYCLIIANKKEKKIAIGKLGEINFEKGSYVYIGSAMNSLIPRLKRHISNDKKVHWHVDYLLNEKEVSVEDIIFTINTERIECKLAHLISANGKEIAKFGCSDCNCNSHLIYFKEHQDSLNYVKLAYRELAIDYNDLKYLLKKIT